jgi:hypothetical protein
VNATYWCFSDDNSTVLRATMYLEAMLDMTLEVCVGSVNPYAFPKDLQRVLQRADNHGKLHHLDHGLMVPILFESC